MAPQVLVATLPSSACSPRVNAAPAEGRGVVDLFDLHAPGLYRLAGAMLHDPDGAQDVVQDTFLKLMHHLASGGSLPNAKGGLYTVAAHASPHPQPPASPLLPP